MKKIAVVVLMALSFFGCKKGAEKGMYDFDFSKISYNDASNIFFDMLIAPKKYADKTVKISGEFTTSEFEGTRYFATVNWDMDGCCPNVLNFIPPETMKYPEDFPAEKTPITVTGKMQFLQIGDDMELKFVADKVEF